MCEGKYKGKILDGKNSNDGVEGIMRSSLAGV
jgi:hypothetical protein